MLPTTSLLSLCLFICCSAVAILPFRSREFSRRTPRFRTSFTIVARHWALGAIPCVFSIATPWPLSGEVLACPRTTADCLVLGKEIQPMAITPKRFTLALTFIAIVGVSCLLLSAQQKSVSVEGYVLNSACPFTKNLDKPISRQCAPSCAKAPSHLSFLSSHASFYFPNTH